MSENETEERGLVPTQEHALARYGTALNVAQLAARIRIIDRGAIKLNVPESFAVAQFAISRDLDVMGGEVQWWVDKDREGGRRLNMKVGREGRTRKTEELARSEGTHFWQRERVILDAVERVNLGFPPSGGVLVEVELHDYKTETEWYNRRSSMTANGEQPEEITRLLGDRPPAWTGYGFVTQGECEDRNLSKMPAINRAKKRGLEEAMRQYKPITAQGAAGVSSHNDADYAVDGVWREVPASELDKGVRAERAKRGADALYGEDPWPARPWDAETTKRAINKRQDGLSTRKLDKATEGQERLLQAQLKLLAGDAERASSFLAYLVPTSTIKAISPSLVLAVLDWLDLDDTETGKVPKKLEWVRTEANACIKARMVQLGQSELPMEGGDPDGETPS